jgi:hypothetical protein
MHVNACRGNPFRAIAAATPGLGVGIWESLTSRKLGSSGAHPRGFSFNLGPLYPFCLRVLPSVQPAFTDRAFPPCPRKEQLPCPQSRVEPPDLPIADCWMPGERHRGRSSWLDSALGTRLIKLPSQMQVPPTRICRATALPIETPGVGETSCRFNELGRTWVGSLRGTAG